MRILDWLKCRFSIRGRALSLYRRGMSRANKHDHARAIEDYTATIDMPNAPPDLKAMALYNRALVHVAVGNRVGGERDLGAVLEMDEPLINVKTMARQKLARMEAQTEQNQVSRESRQRRRRGTESPREKSE